MDISADSISGSQVNEGVAGNATQNIESLVVHARDTTNTYIGCTFNGIPGDNDPATSAMANLLIQAQELIIKDKPHEGAALLTQIVAPGIFDLLSYEKKRIAISAYCEYLAANNQFDEAQKYLSELPQELADDKIVRAWSIWLQFLEGDDSKLDDLHGLLKAYQDSPTIIHLGLQAPDSPLRELASRLIKEITDEANSEIIGKFRIPILSFAHKRCLEGSETEGANLVALVEPHGEVERYKLRYLKLNFRIKALLQSSLLASKDHITLTEWSELHDMLSDVSDIIECAKKNAHEFIDACAIKSLILGLLSRPADAIETIPLEGIKRLDRQDFINLANNYQSLGDWEGLEKLLTNIPKELAEELASLKFIALINQSQCDRAREISNVPESLRRVLDEDYVLGEGQQNLEDVTDFFFAVQIAVHRYTKNNDEEALRYLKDADPADDHDKLLLANALNECDCDKEALDIYEVVFTDKESGFGIHYVNYLRLLFICGYRNRVSQKLTPFAREQIFSYQPLTFFFVQFTTATKGISASIEELSNAIDQTDHIWFKIAWLKQVIETGELNDAHKSIESWGLSPPGPPGDQADYLSLVSQLTGPRDIYQTLYRLFHENPRSFQIQRACFRVFMEDTMRGQSHLPSSSTEVNERCGVVLSSGETILIDDSLRGMRSTLYILSHDELVRPWIGKKPGDSVSYKNCDQTIREIIHPYVWLARHTLGELTKRPEQSAIWVFQASSPEQNVDQIIEHVRSAEQHRRELIRTATSGKIGVLTLMARENQNPLKEWIEVLSSSASCNLPTNCGAVIPRLKQAKGDFLVLDPSSASSIVLQGNISHQLKSAPGLIATVPAVASSFRDLRDDLKKTPSGKLYWDQDHDRVVIDDSPASAEEVCRTIESFLDLLSDKCIHELQPIPSRDLPDGYLQLIELFDPATRDAVYACYGYECRILVSDDPVIRRSAEALGIRVSNSLELLGTMGLLSTSLNEKDLPEAFVRMTNSCLIPSSIPSSVLLYLMSTDASETKIDYFFKNKLSSINFVTNIGVLTNIVSYALPRNDDLPHFQYVTQMLRRRMAVEQLAAHYVAKFIVKSCLELVATQAQRSRVQRYLFDLFNVPIPFIGPYSTDFTMQLIAEAYMRS